MIRAALLIASALLVEAQDRGEQIFNKSCATGYCHGSKGGPGGAPRLAARGFDRTYINDTVAQGLPGTAMPAFGTILPRADLAAVVSYVATLNGVAASVAASPAPTLSGDAARGRDLFYDPVRSFGRCATCHEVAGKGIAVATPIAKVPTDVAGLRALAPVVSTATWNGETMPALVLSKGARAVIFYDLTSPPPVLRTVEPSAVKIAEGSGWKHSSMLSAYNDAELASILNFLRSAVKP